MRLLNKMFLYGLKAVALAGAVLIVSKLTERPRTLLMVKLEDLKDSRESVE